MTSAARLGLDQAELVDVAVGQRDPGPAVAGVAALGHSGDSTDPGYLPNWHYLHVSQDVLPYLRTHGVTGEQVEAMLVHNPARVLAGQERPG